MSLSFQGGGGGAYGALSHHVRLNFFPEPLECSWRGGGGGGGGGIGETNEFPNMLISPQRPCAVRVTVLSLCVCYLANSYAINV